ncbi:hypothetical protein Taro_039149 [Colocasia esculenta]|uniref:Hexosyltransferase n=1 Tax=Colocasia esculenta TaxID=4460 RepID=A0A843WPB0_COLES|nr:hypothetical protein [Colocasia esculenta]
MNKSPLPTTASSPSSSQLTTLAKAEKVALVSLPLFFLALVCVINFPTDFNVERLLSRGAAALSGAPINVTAAAAAPPAPQPPEFRLLMGILTVADRYEDRHLLRLLRSLQPPVPAQIDVKFVLCNITGDEHRVLVAMEIMRYDDIIVLNCGENMNSGKTYTYFSSLPGLFKSNATDPEEKPYDFVMKTDDDTYFRFPELVESLRRQPREGVYWGHVHEEGEHNPLFMRGMGYVLSWDLVEWIATSNITRNNTIGAEDTLVGTWLRDGGKGKNVYSTKGKNLNYDDTKPVQYDYPYPPWTFVPNTISVHRLKDRQKWAETLSYFNVTAGMKPSRFYHLD